MKITLNGTQVSYFVLSAYFDVGLLRYLYFVLVLLLYILIVCANVLFIMVICANRSLHEPMYMFVCSLFVNELYGSTGLFPFLLVHLLSDLHHVSPSFCLLQIFCLYSYGGIEFATLAIMSYDRYLAICCPLQYNRRMTFTKIACLVAVSWVYPFLLNMMFAFGLTAQLDLCGNVINKVYCDNFYVVRLSCSDTTTLSVLGLAHIFTVIFGLILMILYTYVRILMVCFSGSKQTRQKALRTCSPHLASLFNFGCGGFFEIVQSRFNLTSLSTITRVILSLYWLTCQPLVSPLLYGLQMSKIRLLYRNLLFGRKL